MFSFHYGNYVAMVRGSLQSLIYMITFSVRRDYFVCIVVVDAPRRPHRRPHRCRRRLRLRCLRSSLLPLALFAVCYSHCHRTLITFDVSHL